MTAIAITGALLVALLAVGSLLADGGDIVAYGPPERSRRGSAVALLLAALGVVAVALYHEVQSAERPCVGPSRDSAGLATGPRC